MSGPMDTSGVANVPKVIYQVLCWNGAKDSKTCRIKVWLKNRELKGRQKLGDTELLSCPLASVLHGSKPWDKPLIIVKVKEIPV